MASAIGWEQFWSLSLVDKETYYGSLQNNQIIVTDDYVVGKIIPGQAIGLDKNIPEGGFQPHVIARLSFRNYRLGLWGFVYGGDANNTMVYLTENENEGFLLKVESDQGNPVLVFWKGPQPTEPPKPIEPQSIVGFKPQKRLL